MQTQVPFISVLVSLLCLSTHALAQEGARPAKRPPPLLGAVRWDAWYGRGVPVKEVERSLGPKKFHFRLPFFAQVISDSEVRIDGDAQETMEREIAYAAEAGLDYWAFVDYWDDAGLTIALRRYLAAKDKRGLRYCFIEEGDRLDSRRGEAWPRLVRCFQDPNYLKVADGRPLLFLYGKCQKTGKEDFAALGRAAEEAGLKRPYIVLMGWNPKSDWRDAQAMGFDAVSAYAAGGQYRGAMWPYAKLAEHVKADYWGVCRREGIPTVTFATAGWDTRPRIEHPTAWTKSFSGPAVPDPTPAAEQKPLQDEVVATPAQLSAHLRDALAWTAENPDLTPANAVIVYAWNENDEGGWLIPTRKPDGAPDRERVDAVKSAVKAEHHDAR